MLLWKHQTNNQLNKTNMSDMLANCYHLAAVDKHNHDRHSLIHTSTGGKQEEVLFLVSKTFFFFIFFFYACGKASLQQFVKQTAEEGKRLGLKCKQMAGKSCLVKRKIIKRVFLSFSVLIQVIDFFFFYLHAFINWKSSTPATKLEALAQIPTVKSCV